MRMWGSEASNRYGKNKTKSSKTKQHATHSGIPVSLHSGPPPLKGAEAEERSTTDESTAVGDVEEGVPRVGKDGVPVSAESLMEAKDPLDDGGAEYLNGGKLES